MSEQIIELLTISGLWAFAVFLYYHAGKKRGYADGFCAGIKEGHKNVLDALNASSEFLNEQKP